MLTVLSVVGGCSFRSGAEASSSAWRSSTDKALGAALSSLGTARLLLDGERADRLPHPYVVVAIRDTVEVLGKQTSSYRISQPPAGRARDQRTVVALLDDSATLLSAAAVVATAGDDAENARTVAEIQRAYRRAAALQQKLAG